MPKSTSVNPQHKCQNAFKNFHSFKSKGGGGVGLFGHLVCELSFKQTVIK